MSDYIVTSQNAGSVTRKRQFGYGLLKPVTAIFYKWKDDVIGPDGKPVYDPVTKRKKKVEGSGGEVSHSDWVKLDENKRGQKWEFVVDNSVFNPKFENPTKRGVMLGFDEWNNITVPSIVEMVGAGEKSIAVFLDRATSMEWYVEYELVPNGEKAEDGKDYTSFKFLRMTQNMDDAHGWHAERFKKKEEDIPEEIWEVAKNTWGSKIVQNAADKVAKFTTLMSSNEDTVPYLSQLNEWAKKQVEGLDAPH